MCMCKHLCMGARPYLMPKINFTGVGLALCVTLLAMERNFAVWCGWNGKQHWLAPQNNVGTETCKNCKAWDVEFGPYPCAFVEQLCV